MIVVTLAVTAQILQRVPETAARRDPRKGDRSSLIQEAQLVSHLTPTPSGAEPPYPHNHTMDSDVESKGAITDADFETAGGEVGTPPDNADLEDAANVQASVSNGDFASGTFANWTTAGSPTIASDTPHGSYAKLAATNDAITTSAISVPSDAQTFAYDVGYLRVSGQSWVEVYVLSGASFGTSTKVKDDKCSSCNYWSRSYIDLTSYRSSDIKIKFLIHGTSYGPVGIDNVDVEQPFPSFELAGANNARRTDSGDTYAELGVGGTLTSAEFTVDPDANYFTFNMKQQGSLTPYYKIYVATGPSFSTWVQIAYTNLDTTSWEQARAPTLGYEGQDIKVRVERAGGTLLVDDVAVMDEELPGWSIEKTKTSRLDDGAGNHYASVGGTASIISDAFTVPNGAQHISLRARSGSSANLQDMFVYVLSGTGYATSDELEWIHLVPASWNTYRYGLGAYEGQSIKLKIKQTGSGTAGLWVDDTGAMERVLPGWQVISDGALDTGSDARGTYVSPQDDATTIRSDWVNAGVLDTNAARQYRWYAVAYDFAAADLDINIYVDWVEPDGTSTNLAAIFATAAGPGTKYVGVHDDLSDRGYFEIDIKAGAKLYSVGDNAAAQHLSEPFTRRVGLGIDTATGALGFSETDATIGGTVPIAFTRYYNAHSDVAGTLGFRWTHSFDAHLVFMSADVGVVLGSGREEFFDVQTGGSYLPYDTRVHSTLVKNVDNTYAYTTTANQIYRFSSAGVLTSIDDLNGNSIVMGYNGSGQLTTVTAPGGALTLAYDANGRLQTVTDPAGGVTTYDYDSNADLTTVTDAEDGVRTYTYDRHFLETVTDQNDDLVVSNAFDDFGRVTTQTDAADESFELSYEDPGKGATVVTDPKGNSATFYFDRFQRTTDVLDATDRLESYIFDSVGNLESIIDPADAQWDFGFDSNGNVISTEDPLGNPISITWNAQHLPTLVTDARGNETAMTYDSAGNLLTSTDPLDGVTTYTYDGDGNVLTKTDPLDRTWTYTYDADGNQITKTDPLDNTWTYTYDGAGRKISETDPLDNTTTYEYDLLGRLFRITDPLDRVTTFLWDPAGHLLRVTDPMGHETNWDYDERGLVEAKTNARNMTTTYGYDAARRMTSVTDPLGHETDYAYDDAGRLRLVTDPLDNETTYTYDVAGQLASKTDPLDRETTWTYDASGRLSSLTLPNGGETTYGRDADGHVTSVIDPLANETTSTYDELGRLSSTTDPLNNTTTYVYDAASKLTSETDPLDSETTYGYDDAGRKTSVTDPLGNTTTYAYDDAGRMVGTTDATDRSTTYGYDAAGQLVSVTDPGDNETVNAYDDDGRLTSVTLSSGAETTYAYNPMGQLTSKSDPLLNETTYAYDDAGRQTSVTDPLGHTTSYSYDHADRMTSITDELGGVVGLGYDEAGQLTSITDPNEETWTYGYDELGNRASVTDPLDRTTILSYDDAGNLTARVDARDVTTTYGYDDANQLTSVSYPGGSTGYAYDDAGRRTSMTDGTGTTTWGHDDAGQVTSVAAPAGTLAYTYDDAGRRASMTLPGSREVDYAYGTDGQLSSLTDWGSRTVSFGYDEDGNRTSISRPNDIDSSYTYDDAGQVTSIEHKHGTTTLQSFDYTYDDAGNRTSVTTGAGTESYGYDDLNRLTSVSYPGGPNVSYTYDAAGNRETETRGASTTNYDYDAAGELTSVGSTTYDYDENGNLVERGSDTFGWDFDNRLTSATVGSHTASYEYDGDGVRTGSTVDSSSRDYLVDRVGRLPTVVDDGSAAYIQERGLVSAIQGPSVTWALPDALGSIRGLADGSGSVIGTASWESFGSLRSASGSSTSFGFAGEPSDVLGLIDLRSRSLDPETGRMISPDSVRPSATGTGGYNLYAYVANNPTTWSDPTGHSPEVEEAAQIVEVSYLAWEAYHIMLWEAEFAVGAGICAVVGGCFVLALIIVVFVVVLACFISGICRGLLDGLRNQGSSGPNTQPVTDPSGAVDTHPTQPSGGVPGSPPNGTATGDCDPPPPDPNEYRHYTTDEHRADILQSGRINPGPTSGKLFLTTDTYTSAALAQQQLALPETPDGYFIVPSSIVREIQGPTCVEPDGIQPGGGVEYWTQYPIPASALEWVPIGP